ncbi:MAG: methyltransferase domain-containing protein [Actinomycetota bacterium]|nr:methyltransferase domain-containing protein [Actinomycetota bacterium]
MNPRLLDFLRCIDCREPLDLEALAVSPDRLEETWVGLLHCRGGHWFPVVRGIPRMFAGAMEEYWPDVEAHLSSSLREAVRRRGDGHAVGYDSRTRESFGLEWQNFQVGDQTWGMDVDTRVKCFFLDPLRIPREHLEGKVVLDAGCGNGTQSVAYSALGLEVIAVDLSSGLEHGNAYRQLHPGARPERVHFVQADLQATPLAEASVDIIHAAGVLHHTPDTRHTFRLLCRLLRPGGTFFVWLYGYERGVTPLVNGIRSITTRLPARTFTWVAQRLAGAFRVFCRVADATGIRSYPVLSQREAVLALTDIFGAPYAHCHSYPEVRQWFMEEGFDEVWPCNEGRRGFGAVGRRRGAWTEREHDGERRPASVGTSR